MTFLADAIEDKLNKDTLFDFVDASPRYPPKGRLRHLVIFILGGITYSECRVAYEVASSQTPPCDIIVGGSKILTPNDFINDLKNLTKQDDERRHSNGSLSEQTPLLENNVEHSQTVLDETGNTFISACERHITQGGRFISKRFGACTSNICGRTE